MANQAGLAGSWNTVEQIPSTPGDPLQCVFVFAVVELLNVRFNGFDLTLWQNDRRWCLPFNRSDVIHFIGDTLVNTNGLGPRYRQGFFHFAQHAGEPCGLTPDAVGADGDEFHRRSAIMGLLLVVAAHRNPDRTPA